MLSPTPSDVVLSLPSILDVADDLIRAELIMAIGLVVDYVVHIVHFSLHQDKRFAKETRIADALGEIGPSVILGAFTTFIGILPMVFASNSLFRIFFKLFFIVIVFGFFHGIAFIPVALSIIDSRPLSSDSCDNNVRQKSQVEETSSDSSS